MPGDGINHDTRKERDSNTKTASVLDNGFMAQSMVLPSSSH